MGRRNLVRCLAEAEPEGFIAIPIVQAVRTMLWKKFPKARFNVTVGRRWFWGGTTLEELRGGPWSGPETARTAPDDPAAIIFTTGSTGPPKGTLFTHGTFDSQVDQIREFYDIRPGEVDLPAFPLFGLFNCAMGVTAVIPDMDPSRPARGDPAQLGEAAQAWNGTQAGGSPAVWDRVGRFCEERGLRLESVRRVLSAGAPVPAEVFRRMKNCIHPEGEMHSPYGATESLPVASISAREVLGDCPDFPWSTVALGCVESLSTAEGGRAELPHTAEGSCAPYTEPSAVSGTAEQTRLGAGVCVGRRFPRVRWKVIRTTDGPIASINDIEELPPGEIGELIVAGPMVTRAYVTRVEANALAKIADGDAWWHRMGDCGYLDARDRFWFCGRVAHRVLTADGPMYPIRCEAIFNQHPDVRRSALVGVGPVGQQKPVIVIEPKPGRMPRGKAARDALRAELQRLGAASPLTARIERFLLHPNFPVDILHNVKIFREKLAVWAAGQSWPN